VTRSEQIAASVATHIQRRTLEQNAVMLSACKLAYEQQMLPDSVVGQALLEAIRSCEPNYPERKRVR